MKESLQLLMKSFLLFLLSLFFLGCGNGKYLKASPGIITIGCDRSRLLVGVAKEKKTEVYLVFILCMYSLGQ
jgi:hypothetical protein